MQRDPAGYVDGPALYTYVSSNPILHVDPAGLETETQPQTDQPLLCPRSLEPFDVKAFRDKTNKPDFQAEDSRGLKARVRHVLAAFVVCSNSFQKNLRGLRAELDKRLAANPQDGGERARALIDEKLNEARKNNKLYGWATTMEAWAENNTSGPMSTRPKRKNKPPLVIAPKTRGVRGKTDPTWPKKKMIPSNVHKEAFDNKWPPKGLMHLAADLATEMSHFGVQQYGMSEYNLKRLAGVFWSGIDCCCLKKLLGK